MTTTTPSQLIVNEEKKILFEKTMAPAAAPSPAALPPRSSPPSLLLRLRLEMSTVPFKQVKVGFVNGLVPKEKAMAFERILFRATRGSMFSTESLSDQSS